MCIIANKDINEKRASATNRMSKTPPIRIENLEQVTQAKCAERVRK